MARLEIREPLLFEICRSRRSNSPFVVSTDCATLDPCELVLPPLVSLSLP